MQSIFRISSSEEDNVLVDLLRNKRWDEAASRVNTEEGMEEMRRRNRETGQFPLHEACYSSAPVELVEAILEGCPEAVRVPDEIRCLPLNWACMVDISTPVVRLLLDAYPEGARSIDMSGDLPLHKAASANAQLEVIEMLLEAHPEGVITCGDFGHLPVHFLAQKASPNVKEDVEKVELLIRPLLDNEEACRAAGRYKDMLPLHIAAKFDLSVEIIVSLLSTYGDAAKETCKCRRDKKELTLYALDLLEERRPGRRTEEGQSSEEGGPRLVRESTSTTTSHLSHALSSAVPSAAGWGSKTLSRAQRTTPAGRESRMHRGKKVHIDSPETVRHERRTEDGSSDVDGALNAASRLAIVPAESSLIDTTPPWRFFCCMLLCGRGNAQKFYSAPSRKHQVSPDTTDASFRRSSVGRTTSEKDAGDHLESKGEGRPNIATDEVVAEFNEKSDLLFSYNPHILPHRKDEARLNRFIKRITTEARERNLSGPARRVWIWMCTFVNRDDPSDNYVSEIDTILGLGDRKLAEWLASIETTGVRQIREISAPNCAKAINAHFLFAGRLELNRDPPMHKSATCIVVEANDYGDSSLVTENGSQGSALNEYERTVVKFMSDKDQFDREIHARNLTSSQRSSNHTEQPFLIRGITYFDSREFDGHDRKFGKDIQEPKHVFGHDLSFYPYAVVMQRADRNLNSIYQHEVPSMLKIRSYVEDLAKKLELLHNEGKVHADVKLLNVVRLDGALTLIDMDASRIIKKEEAGSKFSSGVLPPEMIYKLKNEEEETKHSAYWKNVREDFTTVEQIVKESNSGMPDALSDCLAKERLLQPIKLRQRLSLYADQSATLKALLENSSGSSEDFYYEWNRMRKNAALWRKVMPYEDDKNGKYVVRAFRNDAKSDDRPPYDFVLADVSLDMWSLGALLFKLCTKTDLFHVNGINDDLFDCKGFAELYDWDLSTASCKAKLARVKNELARDLLRLLLHKDPKRRPCCMGDVLKHDFFRPDYSQRKLALEEDVAKLKVELDKMSASMSHEKTLLAHQLQKKEEELQMWQKPIHSLAQERSWDALVDRVRISPHAIPTDLLLWVCKYGPTVEVVEAIAEANCDLVETRNVNRDLPLHVACSYGACLSVVKQLIELSPRSPSERNAFWKLPLDNAQTKKWTQVSEDQISIVRYLRPLCCPDYFDDLTGLPGRVGLDKWAPLPPPGVQKEDAKVFVLNIDISGFKAVNDNTKDHKIGDDAIRQYASEIREACEECEASAKSSTHLVIDVFRPGGDEFVVVCKFTKSYKVKTAWASMIKPLVESLAGLTFDDSEDPCRYCTFLRIGCCTGNIDRVDDVLEKADELQCKIKDDIVLKLGLKRGEFVSLRELHEKGMSNFSDYVELM